MGPTLRRDAFAGNEVEVDHLKVVAFRSDLSLFNGSGFDGQMELLDTTSLSGRTYNYAVMGVDLWGNVGPLSNSAEATANDIIPPVTPIVMVEENCAGLEADYVVASVADDDMEEGISSEASSLAGYLGKSVKGIWTLKVLDSGFCIPQAPGNAARMRSSSA